jgi:hypothetical protein
MAVVCWRQSIPRRFPKEQEMSDLFRIPNEINPDEPSGLTPDMNPVDDAFLRDQELERQEQQGDEDDEAGEPA